MGTFNIYWRSAVFLIGQTVSTLLLGPIMLLMLPFRFEARYAAARLWVRLSLWMLKRVCGLTYRVTGRENIPMDRCGLIFCKHQSAFETIALQAIFPPVVFILKRELLRIPVWGWAMATLEPIAIDRRAKSQALKQVLRDGVVRIRAGRWVVLFPEGTRVAPGQRGHYGSSGGMLAHRAECPLVPVAHNAGEYWAKNGFLKFPGVIEFHIGPVLDGAALSAAELNRQAEGWIESTMPGLAGRGPRFAGVRRNSSEMEPAKADRIDG
jgi:1-acyl-sn-glycerol-3-phosphate acyltransferase